MTTPVDAIAFVESLDFSIQKLGLDRIQALMAKLGNPQDRLPMVHIAGSNGKGSTSAMLSSILKHAGYSVGTFTSPHLIHVRERVAINTNPILPDDFETEVGTLQAVLKDTPRDDWPTYFEFMAAMGYHYFARKNVDIAVMEVGLGGRFDATNIVKNPNVTVITGISLEHTRILGDTLDKIAAEKAGILKPGVPVVLGPHLPDEAKQVIEARAKALDAPVYISDDQMLEILPSSSLADGLKILNTDSGYEYHLGLLAPYQSANLATVLKIIEVLRQQEFIISQSAIEKGLSETYWPARFQAISKQLVLDGSHNPEGFAALRACVETYIPARPIHWILSLQENRSPEPLLDLVCSLQQTASITWTQASGHVYHDPVAMADLTSGRCAGIPVGYALTAGRALSQLADVLGQTPEAMGLITGSLYTAGEILLAARNGFAAKFESVAGAG